MDNYHLSPTAEGWELKSQCGTRFEASRNQAGIGQLAVRFL